MTSFLKCSNMKPVRYRIAKSLIFILWKTVREVASMFHSPLWYMEVYGINDTVWFLAPRKQWGQYMYLRDIYIGQGQRKCPESMRQNERIRTKSPLQHFLFNIWKNFDLIFLHIFFNESQLYSTFLKKILSKHEMFSLFFVCLFLLLFFKFCLRGRREIKNFFMEWTARDETAFSVI